MAAAPSRTRDQRIEVRATAEERALISRAASESGADLTTFVLTNLTDAARRVLADRDHFALTPAAEAEWERINDEPARDLPGLRKLLERRSPFEG